MIDREVAADNLMSKCPPVSGAGTGRCLTALTDKSCQGHVCDIEQELKCFQCRKWKNAVVEKCVSFSQLFILTQVCALWTNVT